MTTIIYNRLIKPLRTQLIQDTVGSMLPLQFSPHDQQLSYAERLEPIALLKRNIIKWASRHIWGLDQFSHMYVMNGNTDRINRLFSAGPVRFLSTDYSYYSVLGPPSLTPGDPSLVTWPGYSQGNTRELNLVEISSPPNQIHLDSAYLGLTRDCEVINVSRFASIAISFSKTLAIPFNRISVLFTHTPDPQLDVLNSIGYVNLSGVHIANKLLVTLPPDYWSIMCGAHYDNMCSRYQLTPSNCFLFAFDRRGARVSTAPYWRQYSPEFI
jgi:hypothetical protein